MRAWSDVYLLIWWVADMVSLHFNPNHNMLQIPSSIHSLSSSFKGFIGLFSGVYIGAQVAVSLVVSGLSVPNLKIQDSLLATPTTQTILSPTKSVLSNDTVSYPYRAAFIVAGVYVFFTCAVVFSILRRPRMVLTELPSPATEPPSPPPQPGSSSSANKTPPRRWLWLLLLLAIVLLVGGAYIYFTLPDIPVPLLALTCIEGHLLSVIERYLQIGCITAITRISTCVSTIKNSISAHGSHYTRVIGLALASHSGCIFLYRRSSRLRLHVVTRITGSLNYYSGAAFLGSVCFFAFVPPLRWVLWGIYVGGLLLVVSVVAPLEARGFLVCPSILSDAWCSIGLEERAIFIGPATLHLAAAILIGLWRSVLPAMQAFKRLAASVRSNPMLLISFLRKCAHHTKTLTAYGLVVAITSIDIEFLLNPRHEQVLSEHPYLSRLWFGSLQRVYEDYCMRYRAWTSVNVNYWLRSARFLLRIPRSIFATWQTFCGIQKMVGVSSLPVLLHRLIRSCSSSSLRSLYTMAIIISSPLLRDFRLSSGRGAGDDPSFTCTTWLRIDWQFLRSTAAVSSPLNAYTDVPRPLSDRRVSGYTRSPTPSLHLAYAASNPRAFLLDLDIYPQRKELCLLGTGNLMMILIYIYCRELEANVQFLWILDENWA
ncbi:hypothetical protein C8F04DRAFT_1236528 [Mycena alexandri]|uniref:Uncharacterized protein n=1 Tax=Mycena alexandri TaxID=1745969 RepID=A0AAD6SMP7_9AGAR|nr:hypothetical protein C8F04DRAFT_1236528 [Mycena alexandri]